MSRGDVVQLVSRRLQAGLRRWLSLWSCCGPWCGGPASRVWWWTCGEAGRPDRGATRFRGLKQNDDVNAHHCGASGLGLLLHATASAGEMSLSPGSPGSPMRRRDKRFSTGDSGGETSHG